MKRNKLALCERQTVVNECRMRPPSLAYASFILFSSHPPGSHPRGLCFRRLDGYKSLPYLSMDLINPRVYGR